MANDTGLFGLKPVRHLNGSPWNGQVVRAYISANDATANFVGDPMIITATTADRDTTAKALTVEVATEGDGNYVTGVITSFEPDADNLTLKYRTASTARYCYLCIDPTVIYQIRDDGTSALDKNAVGGNANLESATAGSTYTGLSGWAMDTADTAPAANASYQLTILQLSDFEENELAIYAMWDVLINMQTFRSTGDGDGSLGIIGA